MFVNSLKIENWKLKILVAALFFFLWQSNARAATILRPPLNVGLVGYWDMETGVNTNKTYDRSGNNNTGTLTGMNTAIAWVDGPTGRGQALSFDGTDDYVRIADNASLDNLTTGTISFWWRPDYSGAPGVYKGLISKSSSAVSTALYGGYHYTDGKLYFHLNNLATDMGSFSPIANTWYHMVFSWDGTNVRRFTDGALITTTANSNGSGASDFGLYIGGYSYDSEAFIQVASGSIDDVRIYNRVLSEREVERLYKTTKSKVASNQNSLGHGLVGYWDFNTGKGRDKAYDRSGNANTGTLTSMNTATAWVDGPTGRGQALSFDGTDDYVDLGDTSVVDFGSGNYAFSAWIKPTLATTGFIIGKDDDVNGRQLTFSIASNGDSYMQLFYGPDNPAAQNTVYKATAAVQANVWQHILGQRIGNKFEIYVNAIDKNATYDAAISAADFPQTMQATAANLNIGRRSYSTSMLPFPGSIDDVRIYNRALSASEIERLYKTQKSKFSVPINQGLVGYWNFDVGSEGLKAFDLSGNNNTGTLTGMDKFASWVDGPTGKMGKALSFDGNNDYVDIGNDIRDTDTNGTITAWIKPTTNADYREILISTTSGDDNKIFAFGVNVQAGNTGKLYVQAYDDPDFNDNVQVDKILSPGIWYYVSLTSDGSIWKFYIDGVLQSSTVVAGSNAGKWFNSISSGTQNYRIGYLNTTYPNPMLGKIDDVRIYNRALPADEIKRLYNLGR
ncbi:LamG domain-containing protein [Candidatus Giovannonibacteria bacterium]|nr:LamG domain-containing protein [Candidatus Giovannonibacteria bacterium]